MSETLRVLLTGGGTGGHVYPGLAVASRAAEQSQVVAQFRYAGTDDGMERSIVEKAGIPFEAVDAGPVRGRSPAAALAGLVRCLRGIRQARQILKRFQPRVVLATGGFVCVPVVLAAHLCGIPSVVYLPDLRPGWAVRLLARVASAVAVSFEEVRPFVPGRQVVVTGYPVRPELLRWTRGEGRRSFGIPESALVLLVIGGSRGARTINDAISRDLVHLLEQAFVIHASGVAQYPSLSEHRQQLPDGLRSRYHLYPYLESELAPALAAASLVVARAGASSLGEFPAAGLPAILVPYPFAGAHQWLNARFLVERGAAIAVDDAVAQHGGLVRALDALIRSPDRLDQMRLAAQQLAVTDGAGNLLELVIEIAGSSLGRSVGRLV